MDENMNLEVTTEVSGADEVTQEITIEEPSGQGKGLVALIAGGIAAVAVAATVAYRKYKKKKVTLAEEVSDDEYFEEDLEPEESEPVETEEIQKKETSEEPAKEE